MKIFFKISIFRFWSMHAPFDVDNKSRIQGQGQVTEKNSKKKIILPHIARITQRVAWPVEATPRGRLFAWPYSSAKTPFFRTFFLNFLTKTDIVV